MAQLLKHAGTGLVLFGCLVLLLFLWASAPGDVLLAERIFATFATVLSALILLENIWREASS